MEITLPLILSTGLIDSLNPCAVSLLLLYIALLYSMKKSHKTIMIFGLFYILAIYVTYFLIGIGLLKVINIFGVPSFIPKAGGILALTFGLLNIREYFFPNSKLNIRIPMNIRAKVSEWAHKATIPAALVLGALVGLHEFPCSGAVYITIIAFLSKNESFIRGIIYLLIYNAVFVLPLFAVYAFASNPIITQKLINTQEKLGRKMHLVLAFLMISLGIFMLLYKH